MKATITASLLETVNPLLGFIRNKKAQNWARRVLVARELEREIDPYLNMLRRNYNSGPLYIRASVTNHNNLARSVALIANERNPDFKISLIGDFVRPVYVLARSEKE